ncbi:MAG TPA: hypothetical protein PKJ08_00195 [Candidatus Cloacimonadota bacterium]|nr:hypothetical protein [Candidatus Cloacimonadota bacterium]
MLDKLMNEMITKLEQTNLFKQIEPYEGQFDNPDEFLIRPPVCFIEFSAGQTDKALHIKSLVNVDFYITTNHIKGRVNSAMLDILDTIKEQFNKKRIANMGETRFIAFDRLAIFPGFCSYRVSLEFKEDF